MNIEHISVSRRGTFYECQQKYKYRYHLKVPPPGEEPFYFEAGKFAHRVAEIYVEAGGRISVDQAAQSVLTGDVELEKGRKVSPLLEWPKTYRDRLGKWIRSIEFISKKIGFGGENYVEHEFYYDLDGDGRHVKGFIDRILIKNGNFFVVDYKTTKKGKYRETATTILDNLQLRIYARVAQRDFGADPKKIKCALFYLDDAVLLGARFSEKSLELAEEQLLEAYKQIENTNPERVFGRVGQHCTRCDYNNICPFYKK